MSLAFFGGCPGALGFAGARGSRSVVGQARRAGTTAQQSAEATRRSTTQHIQIMPTTANNSVTATVAASLEKSMLGTLGWGTANHNHATLCCCVCAGKSSCWERVLFELCDAEPLAQLCLVEAHSLNKSAPHVKCDGVRVWPEAECCLCCSCCNTGPGDCMRGEAAAVNDCRRPTTLTAAWPRDDSRAGCTRKGPRVHGWGVLWCA